MSSRVHAVSREMRASEMRKWRAGVGAGAGGESKRDGRMLRAWGGGGAGRKASPDSFRHFPRSAAQLARSLAIRTARANLRFPPFSA
jgi:hypothetical protein